MKYLEGTKILCLEYHEYVREEILTQDLFWQQKTRVPLTVHGNGATTLIEYDSLPAAYKAKVFAMYGNPYEYIALDTLRSMIKRDMEARQFYAEYELPTGELIAPDVQSDYSRQCDYLNLLNDIIMDRSGFKKLLQVDLNTIYNNVLQLAKADSIRHSLPTSQRRMLDKRKRYGLHRQYESVIDLWRYGNNHSRIVSPEIENLILAIYAQYDGRTTITQAAKEYNAFLQGKKHLIDINTGELYHPESFFVDGNIKTIAPATVQYYINKKSNREAIDLMKLSQHSYTAKHRIHNRRHKPTYALSTVSMDDYLPPFKTLDGKRKVWMYAVFDVASTAILGVAYGTQKNWSMVLDALADMARNCLLNGWGLPLELEMERHLNYEHKGSAENPDIFTEGHIFQHIRFVRGGNSQGKIVERFIGNFKYENLARQDGFLGRPHGRNENYKYNEDIAEIRYPTDELIAMLKAAVSAYNSEEYKDGLSRWEWMAQHINPDTVKYAPQTLLPELQKPVKTSVHRGLVQVKNNSYEVNTADFGIAHDHKGRVPVDAYYLADDLGAIDTVYLFQNDKYIGEGHIGGTYNYSTAERTSEDWAEMNRQTTKQYDFMQSAKERLQEIPKVAMMDAEPSRKRTKVRPEYDKLSQEEEQYAEIASSTREKSAKKAPETPPKNAENALKEGGYVQKNEVRNYTTYAISSL